MLERALRGLEGSDPQLAVELHRQLGRAEMFRARPQQALDWVEAGLAAAARLDDVGAIADLLITRAWAAGMLGRTREAIAENRGALAFAREHGLIGAELRAVNNLATFLLDENPAESIRLADEAMEVAERIGDRDNMQKLAFVSLAKVFAGDWDGRRGRSSTAGCTTTPRTSTTSRSRSAGRRCWHGPGARPTPTRRRGSCASDSRPRRASRTASGCTWPSSGSRRQAAGTRRRWRPLPGLAEDDRELGWIGLGGELLSRGCVAARRGDLATLRGDR